MKRIVLGSLLATSLMFAATSSNVCPDMSKKTVDTKLSEGIESGLILTFPTMWQVYSESLQKYNNANDIKLFVTKESITDYSITPIWQELMDLHSTKHLLINILHECGPDDERVKRLDVEYHRLLNTIDAKNPNWCKERIMNVEIKNEIISIKNAAARL